MEADEAVRNSASAAKPRRVRPARRKNAVPDEILHNEALNQAIAVLPSNYNFEIHKTIWRIQQENAKLICLQLPEGLQMYACILSDIFEHFAKVRVIILADVTYGACCIDDFTSRKLGADLLVHYGHSCLVPVGVTSIKVLYVFVEISFDTSHLVECIQRNFDPAKRIALMGTIQFASAIHDVKTRLEAQFPQLYIPQAKPLSPGETLGCTAPVLSATDEIIFVADGRFHMEAAMIANPNIPAFRYDPYSKVLTREVYETERMKVMRWEAISRAKSAHTVGIILGTLGRQGNPAILRHLKQLLLRRGIRVCQFLMAEVMPQRLALHPEIDAWVQIACPRLSIDWGSGFDKPVLTPYEMCVAMESTEWKEVYPMDFYADGGGPWANMHHRKPLAAQAKQSKPAEAVATATGAATVTS